MPSRKRFKHLRDAATSVSIEGSKLSPHSDSATLAFSLHGKRTLPQTKIDHNPILLILERLVIQCEIAVIVGPNLLKYREKRDRNHVFALLSLTKRLRKQVLTKGDKTRRVTREMRASVIVA